MGDEMLDNCHVLVVEDEYLLADDLSLALEAAGAVVIGPVPSVAEAVTLIEQAPRIDLAVLDVNLRGEMVFPVADALDGRGVPFVLATGYDQWALPERFSSVPHIEKPFKPDRLSMELRQLLAKA